MGSPHPPQSSASCVKSFQTAADIRQCDVFSVRNNLQGVNVIAYTCALKEDFGVPKVSAVGLLTGIGADAVVDKVADALKD